MALFPNTRCPKCNGPVTFVEVMSIVTPFQSIDCSTCGEMLFLGHKSEIFLISLAVAWTCVLLAFFLHLWKILPPPLIALIVLAVLVASELLITAYVLKKNDLVVRRPSPR